ncbi:hypothetical protein PTSG_04848 [Salpingoeca rosetta]|uniref:BAR domain-containing protein n=1 Tax=Salpingoeca rosetta (strain ATCC 50818 / BSB-021) TaxID=946362 RepID=F2U9V8_SALR5|nr:uncharacterized protein PTSG_04848 [Salpingoeca rosetta]EGD73135.1 hypothetical protein PTSG_04848 [Salpingoeca rosetta]|eukprot:XP_004994166.1 hypothetical protein PTSG_04848 [Salpingoeca rosetta]
MFRLRSRPSAVQASSLVPAEMQQSIKDYRRMEATMQAILKACKAYLGAIDVMNKARTRLRDNLNDIALFKQPKDEVGAPSQGEIEKMKRVAEGIVFLGTHRLSDQIKRTLHDPLKKFVKIFPNVNDCIKHYEKVASDCEKAKDKYAKLTNSSSSDSSKIDKAKAQKIKAEQAWSNENEYLPEELPLLYELRLNFFEPSLAALAGSQKQYLEGLTDTLEAFFDQVAATDEEYLQEIDTYFAELQQLSITE